MAINLDRNIDALPAKSISSSTNVCGVEGFMSGIFVTAASNTPTITIYDDPATGTGNAVIATFTPTAATFYRIPMQFYQGCYIAIGGTVSLTAFVIAVRR